MQKIYYPEDKRPLSLLLPILTGAVAGCAAPGVK